jgi:azurin
MLSTVLAQQAQEPPPQIFLDKSPAIVAYQLKRLSNVQLVSLDRKTTDPKYRPIYEAILTRKGLDRKFRDEAVAALATIDHSDVVVEMLDAISKVDSEDKATPRELAGMLIAQPAALLSKQREKIKSLASESQSDLVKQAAFAAMAVADGKPDEAWKLASSNEGGVPALLAGIPLIKDTKLRGALFDRVNPLVSKAPDEATQVAAIDAISSIPAHEAETFKELAQLVTSGSGAARDAAIRSIRRIPPDRWPQEQIEPLAKAIVKLVQDTPADQRTTPQVGMAVQLGNDLAGELADEQGLPIKKQLRELGVRVVVIRTLREQMQYDTRYFAVQAGKPVQVVLQNDDAMPHNLVITSPGAMQEVAIAAGTMPPPSDLNAKTAYVPDSPKVLQSLSMVQPGESESLNFTAPTMPGEYDYVCTFPGHWVRMYGVIVVVSDLDAWEKNARPPTDPVLRKPFDSQKNEATGAMPMEH